MQTLAGSPRINELDRDWQCIVIGAGPAGSMASLQLARRGVKVLLIEKAVFPRAKICGCCINASAQRALVEAGLPELLKDNRAVPIDDLFLFDGSRRSSIKLPTAWSLSRERFDFLLAEEAINCGATFLCNSFAQVLNEETDQTKNTHVQIRVEEQGSHKELSANVVVIADGLSGRSLELLDDFKPTIDHSSRFGAGVILDEAPEYYSPGHIYMACADGGYVGLVRLEDGRLDVAAAFDHGFSRQFQGPAHAALEILSGCGLPIPDTMQESPWGGTQLLTRRRSLLGGHRLLVAGDASGYPEPFTGEGIAWALWSGLWAGRLAAEAVDNWHEEIVEQWQRRHLLLKKQQNRSALIAKLLRSGLLRSTLMTTFDTFPGLTSHVVRKVSDPNFATTGVR